MSINRIFWQLRASLSKLIVGSRHKLDDVTISITYAATADSSRETNSRRVGAESVPGNGPARKIVSRICNANTPYLALGGQWDSLVWTLGKGRTSKKGGGKIGRRSKNRFLLPFFFFFRIVLRAFWGRYGNYHNRGERRFRSAKMAVIYG